MNAELKTIKEVRELFWTEHPEFKNYYRKTYRQNDYCVNIRCSFTDFVDMLHRDNRINDKLAQRVTL